VLGVGGRRGAERRAVQYPFVAFHAATLSAPPGPPTPAVAGESIGWPGS
jgi:hypothetical protein